MANNPHGVEVATPIVPPSNMENTSVVPSNTFIRSPVLELYTAKVVDDVAPLTVKGVSLLAVISTMPVEVSPTDVTTPVAVIVVPVYAPVAVMVPVLTLLHYCQWLSRLAQPQSLPQQQKK